MTWTPHHRFELPCLDASLAVPPSGFMAMREIDVLLPCLDALDSISRSGELAFRTEHGPFQALKPDNTQIALLPTGSRQCRLII